MSLENSKSKLVQHQKQGLVVRVFISLSTALKGIWEKDFPDIHSKLLLPNNPKFDPRISQKVMATFNTRRSREKFPEIVRGNEGKFGRGKEGNECKSGDRN
ncbi:hypothetical protein CEXT_115381 [Caerostris extrusa]|uniref:Uncharacterized protein n=1 Tax=Caerostris extrusa TaxID=172846 RepID=A0AAV4Y1B9_CAEEX|nr:hypothetical protein CEXT_115381 [Caerostris extrusa]